MSRKSSIFCSIVLAVLAAAMPMARGAEEDPKWKALVARLSDVDFATRDAAQKELAKVDWRSLGILKKLAAGENDDEAAARLKARIVEIEEGSLLDPHPISVDLDNAPLNTVAVALAAATNLKIESSNATGEDVFTLHAKEKPFWEVVRELNRQHTFTFQNYTNDGIRLYPAGNDLSRLSAFGPVAVVPLNLTRSRRSNLTAAPGSEIEPEQLQFNYMVMIDPRVKVVNYRQPIIQEVTDSNGASLARKAPVNQATITPGRSSLVTGSYMSTLEMPPRPAKSIVSLKGSFTYTASIGEVVAIVDEAEKKVGQSVQLGESTVKLSRFDLKENSINVMLEREQATPLTGTRPSINVDILDQNDRKLWSLTLTTSSSGGFSSSSIAAPLKIRFSMPVKTKQVTLPFELKDLPLP